MSSLLPGSLPLLPSSRKHDIAFHENGRIDISAHVARSLSLAPGDVIDITLSDNGEWLLYVKLRAGHYCGRHHGLVYATNRHALGSFRVWSRPLARAAIQAAGQKSLLRCPCGEIISRNNITYVTIIYRLPL